MGGLLFLLQQPQYYTSHSMWTEDRQLPTPFVLCDHCNRGQSASWKAAAAKATPGYNPACITSCFKGGQPVATSSGRFLQSHQALLARWVMIVPRSWKGGPARKQNATSTVSPVSGSTSKRWTANVALTLHPAHAGTR